MADVAKVEYVGDTTDHIVSNVTREGETLHRTPAVTVAIAKRAGANAVVVAEKILERVSYNFV